MNSVHTRFLFSSIRRRSICGRWDASLPSSLWESRSFPVEERWTKLTKSSRFAILVVFFLLEAFLDHHGLLNLNLGSWHPDGWDLAKLSGASGRETIYDAAISIQSAAQEVPCCWFERTGMEAVEWVGVWSSLPCLFTFNLPVYLVCLEYMTTI